MNSHTVRPETLEGGRTRRQHGAILAVVCVALASVVAAMSSLNVALPDIAADTHASGTQLEWVIDAYSLMFAALLLPAGALGDRFGRRLALIGGLTIFGAGSAIAMTAGSAHELILLRGVLGIGAALVMPATLSTITGTFAPELRTRAVSVWAAVAGGAAVLGLLCSGLLLEVFSWRSVFALNVVLAAAALIGTFKFVPESADRDAPRLDLGGAVLAALGLGALVYSIIEAPDYGWLSTHTLVGLGIGLCLVVGFVVYELRSKQPMLDPRIFRHRRLSAGSLSIFVQFFAFYGFTFVILQYLQLVRGSSPLLSAVSMLPLAATMMPAARMSPKLVGRFGTKPVCVAGLLLIAAALVILGQLDAHSSYWLLLAGLLPLGLGMGAAMTPATSAITEALPAAQQGVASAMNDLSREVGGALGIAVVGSTLTAVFRSHLTLPGLPAALAEKAKEGVAVTAHIGGQAAAHGDQAFASGLHVAFLVAAGAAAGAAVVVAFLLPRGEDPDYTEASVEQDHVPQNVR